MRSTRDAGHGTRLKGEAILFNYGSQGKSQVQLDGGEKHEREESLHGIALKQFVEWSSVSLGAVEDALSGGLRVRTKISSQF